MRALLSMSCRLSSAELPQLANWTSVFESVSITELLAKVRTQAALPNCLQPTPCAPLHATFQAPAEDREEGTPLNSCLSHRGQEKNKDTFFLLTALSKAHLIPALSKTQNIQ
ncbi:hypothetical protein AAFF_G00171960 [Aldrovandia affinis]|uniref:Uncharacterized protein n=1 Tax=Aldrovandia affinis TaxID=143900 RepID=A0AAD7SYV7_9TELE|nr:hypothetical protein AAFF_G00171960 [Aldrovandia affinis]